ncbi:MAG: hypothetical protein ACXW1F_07820 [Halobacteriota archaeon]
MPDMDYVNGRTDLEAPRDHQASIAVSHQVATNRSFWVINFSIIFVLVTGLIV